MFSNKPSSALKLVKLKNGTEITEVTMVTTMMCLKGIQNNPVALYELLEKCNKPEYKMFGNTEELAKKCGLILNGSIHQDTKNVILSAVESTGPLCFKISSPVAESSFTNKM